MSKKNVTNTSQAIKKQTNKQAVQKSKHGDVKAQLTKWAHEGTKESIDNILDFINKTKDDDLKGFAHCAYEEASYFYYGPQNDDEESDFLLAKMILNKEKEIETLLCRIESGEFKIKRLKLDERVHHQLLKKPNLSEDWKYRFSEDYFGLCEGRVEELKDDIAYNKAWIEAAKKLIKHKKYQTIPEDVLLSIHFDWEDDSFPFENEER